MNERGWVWFDENWIVSSASRSESDFDWDSTVEDMRDEFSYELLIDSENLVLASPVDGYDAEMYLMLWRR